MDYGFLAVLNDKIVLQKVLNMVMFICELAVVIFGLSNDQEKEKGQ